MLKPEFETIGSLSTSCLKYIYFSLSVFCCCCWEYTMVHHNIPHQHKRKSYQNSYSSIHSFTFTLNSTINTLRVYISIHFWHTFSIHTDTRHKKAHTITHSLVLPLAPFHYRFWSNYWKWSDEHTYTTQPSPNRHENCSKKILFSV